MTPDEPRLIYVGDQKLDKSDRHVLAAWSGQTVPAKGSVYLMLDREQWMALDSVMDMLRKR